MNDIKMDFDKIRNAYIEGVFEVLVLLNEDNHGREFYLTEVIIRNKNIEESLKNLIGNQYEITLHQVENFNAEIETVYGQFCQNFSHKMDGLEEEKKRTNENIKKLFVSSLIDFSKDAFKVDEVNIKGDYLYGLPYKGYLLFKEHGYYFLHFGILS